MLSFLHPARLIASALARHVSPREFAWGVALGMLVGLIPKGNLTALVLAVLLFSLRVNLAAGVASACAFSWIGMMLDPFAHRLGWRILSCEPLQPAWAWFYELPLVPWSGLNNTVVVGQLAIGLYAIYPIFWLTLRLDSRLRCPVGRAIGKLGVGRMLIGADLATRLDPSE